MAVSPIDKREPPSLLLLGLMTALGPLSLNIFVPSLPSMERGLAVSLADLQWTLTLYFVAFGVLQLVVGPLSDRYGRRPVFLVGFGVFALASVGAALARTLEWLVAARTVQALGAATAVIVPRAIVQDTHSGAGAARAMAFVAMLQSVAPAVAPFLGGLIELFLDWRFDFWLLAAWAALMVVVAWRALPETRDPDNVAGVGWGEMLARYRRLLGSARFLGYTLNLSFMVAIFFAFLTAGPTLLQGLFGLSALRFSWVLMAIALGFLAGNLISTWLTPRFGIDRMLALFSALILAATGALALLADSSGVWAVIVPTIVYGVGNGVVFPNAIAGATGVDRTIAGAAASFMGLIQFAIGAAATFTVGHLALDSVAAFAWPAVASAVVSLAVLALVFAGPKIASRPRNRE